MLHKNIEQKVQGSEVNIITQITGNPEATMNQIASNSVAMAILQLKDIYLGKTPDQKALDDNYKQCVEELKGFKVADFFKDGEEQKEQNAALKKEITEQLQSVIKYIIDRANDRDLSLLDVVTLYLPDADKPKNFREEKLQLPLNIVLPLVLKACNDDDKFAHHYEGTDDEKLSQAQKDRPLRRLTLFKCFQRTKVGICHQGIRNELVLLLNGVYENINIIEDTAATVLYLLKEKIYQKFLESYNSRILSQDGNEAKTLLSALFTWMIECNPTKILEIIDPQNKIKADLTQYFIQNGSDPSKLSVKYDGENISFHQLVEKSCSRVAFAPDSKYIVLSMINMILNADNEVKNQEIRNKALTLMQKWITNGFTFSSLSHHKKVSNFYIVYQAHQQLQQHMSLLVLTGNMTNDVIQELIQECNNYYKNFIKENETPIEAKEVIPELTLSKIKEFNNSIVKSKQDSMSDKIENFFIHWFGAYPSEHNQHTKDWDTLRHLYSMLLEEAIQAKILLNDKVIQKFNETNIDMTFRDITPYEINRVFLHAIIQKPENWTPLFAITFQEVLTFVKNNFNQNNSGPELALKEKSYPPRLTGQLEYLQKRYSYLLSSRESKEEKGTAVLAQPIRPPEMILLPDHIQSAEEWFEVSTLLDNEKREVVYRVIRVSLNPLLIGYIQSVAHLSHVLNFIPETQYNAFLVEEKACAKVRSIIQSVIQLGAVLNFLPEADYKTILTALGDEKIESIIQNVSQLCEILDLLPEEQRQALLAALGNEKVKSLIQKGSQLSGILSCLPAEQRLAFLTALGNEKVKSLIENWRDLDLILHFLPEAQHQAFLTAFDNEKLKSIILEDKIDKFFIRWFEVQSDKYTYHTAGRDTLRQLYLMLLEEAVQAKILLNDKVIQKFNETRVGTAFHDFDIRDIMLICRLFLHAIIQKPEDWTPLFASIFEKVLLLVKNNFGQNGNFLCFLLEKYYPPQLIEQLEYLQKRYSYLLTSRESKEEKGTAVVTQPIRPSSKMILLPDRIQKAEEWFEVSKLLDNEKHAMVYWVIRVSLNSLLIEYIQSVDQLSHVLDSIPATQRKAFLLEEKICEKVRSIIQSVDQLSMVLSYLPAVDRRPILMALGDEKIKLIASDERDLIAILSSLPEPKRNTDLGKERVESSIDTHHLLLEEQYKELRLFLAPKVSTSTQAMFSPKPSSRLASVDKENACDAKNEVTQRPQ